MDVWPHQGLDEGAGSGGRHSHAKCTFSLLFPRGDKNNARKKQKGGEKSGPCAVLVDGICHKKGQFGSLRKKKLFCLAPCSVASWVKVLTFNLPRGSNVAPTAEGIQLFSFSILVFPWNRGQTDILKVQNAIRKYYLKWTLQEYLGIMAAKHSIAWQERGIEASSTLALRTACFAQ